jgi:glycosyltransferase involved in cell wall biosynthesis
MKESSVANVDKKAVIRVGYLSPCWPLSHYPSGIVAYIQNILDGLDNKTKAIILTEVLGGLEPSDDIINYSSLAKTISSWEMLLDKVLYRINLPYSHFFLYKKNTARMAQSLALAIQQLKEPLDIFEIEESLGISGFLVKKTKVPVVTRLHGPWFIHAPIMQLEQARDYKHRVFFEGEGIKNSHSITSPSLDVLEKVREYYGVALPHAQVIPNPVAEVRIDKQWRYNPSSSPSILVVGRFDLHKGGDLALEAFRLIALKNKDVELLFVGPDLGVNIKGESVKFNEYIERFIPEASVKKRIQFLGQCDHARISELRQSSLVTMVCSRYENFPLTLLEALSTGCPTVATAVGGIKEIIINKYNGLLAHSASPESIAEKVLELIDDPEKMLLLSQNAIEDCKKRFSPKVVAAQTVDYYRSVLAKL